MNEVISPEKLESLQRSWVGLFERLGFEPAAVYPAFDDLVARYQEPHRHYHNLEHIAEVLKIVGKLSGRATNLDAIQLAGWYHDAIYDSKAKDNETRSADLALETLGKIGLAAGLIEQAAALIRATAHSSEPPSDIDAAILLDADLAILAAEEKRYRRYAADIRREYAWVEESAYRAGRSEVLAMFLKRPRIFQTELMFELGEAAARRNLAWEVEHLSANPD